MREPREVHDELRARLREAAGAHEPDRARILARLERGMAGPGERRPARRAARPPLLGWVRVLGATAAVAGILAVGGYAVASAVREEAPAGRPVAVPPVPDVSPEPTTPASNSPSHGSRSGSPSGPDRPRPSRSGTPAASATPTASRTPAGHTADGPLWSDGSVDPHGNEFWAQSDVTLKTSEQLTSLTVTLKVRRTEGVRDTGAWRSLPEADFTTTVDERDGFLVYTWALEPGRTVWPGEWVFAGQYDHARGGRDAKDDGYTVTATAKNGEQASVSGDFAAQGAVGKGS
ncbi:hypothetical protein [Streptomyces aureus]